MLDYNAALILDGVKRPPLLKYQAKDIQGEREIENGKFSNDADRCCYGPRFANYGMS